MTVNGEPPNDKTSPRDLIDPGDPVAAHGGRHAGKTGAVVKALGRTQEHPEAPVLVKFINGGPDYCSMRNLEKVTEPPDGTPSAHKAGTM